MDCKRFTMKIENIIQITITLFGLFIIYQIVKRMLGGSWEIETVLLALVIFAMTITFSTTFRFNKHLGEFKEFKRSMLEMTKDFKEFRKETNEKLHSIDLKLSKPL